MSQGNTDARPEPPPVYRFGAWEIDLARREMRLNGVPTDVGSRAFEIVEALVQSAGELVDKYDLMNRVWPGAVVEENTLQAQISAIRKVLGPDRGLLKTIAGRGYRLCGDWIVQREDFAAVGTPIREPIRSYVTNLTASPSELIGRKTAKAQLSELLSTYRMVTMTGPGGIGKSVLAQAVARDLFETFGGDGLLVELVSVSDPTMVPFVVATVLGLEQGGGEISIGSIAREIGARRLLLVLDNCEHLIEATARLAETLLRSCPRTTILATSREVLRIDGEYVYRVPPLDVPAPGGVEDHDILGRSAVQLLNRQDKSIERRILAARARSSAGRRDFASARWHPLGYRIRGGSRRNARVAAGRSAPPRPLQPADPGIPNGVTATSDSACDARLEL
jgi:DNA-binding winged helix-turn-helix (wHTH) protein